MAATLSVASLQSTFVQSKVEASKVSKSFAVKAVPAKIQCSLVEDVAKGAVTIAAVALLGAVSK